MKFANKYELFEAVTSGRVETFFAKDLSSGERVLLHIFEAPEKRSDQPTVLWVLESFRNVAPDPPGLVLETGGYSGTTYAYLVTKLPDDAALQQWMKSYESPVKAQEIAIPPKATLPESPAASKQIPPPNDRPAEKTAPLPKANPPDAFTAAFSDLASPVSPRSEVPTPKKTAQDEIDLGPETSAPRREPGDFTRQFFSGSLELPQKPPAQAPPKPAEVATAPHPEPVPLSTEKQKAAKPEAESPKAAPGGTSPTAGIPPSPDPGSFTALFQSSFKSETKMSSESVDASRKPEDTNAGNFTDFFRGPFDGERPAETPDIPSKPMDTPPGKAPGEFTRVFGLTRDDAFAASPPLQSPVGDASRDPGAFTQLFSDSSQPAASSPMNTPVRAAEPIAQKTEILTPSIDPTWTPQAAPPAKAPVIPSIEPILSKPTVSNTLREAEPSLPAGATHVFSSPGARPGPAAPPLPAGPSEYTRIIAGGAQPPSDGPPGFKLPPVPVVPPPPKVAVPAPPKLSSPPAPKASQPDSKTPKPTASYLPLVIILNVLLFVAILLIVYFAMKR